MVRYVYLSISLFFLTATGCLAQSGDYLDREVFTVVEKPPEYPGGIEALWAYLRQNVQHPPEALKARVKGRVFISFIVQKDGQLTDFTVEQGLGYGCDEEALRVLRAMPRWKPGSQSGRLLRVKYQLPVLFGLQYPTAKIH